MIQYVPIFVPIQMGAVNLLCSGIQIFQADIVLCVPEGFLVFDHVTDPDGDQVVFYIATSYFDLKLEIFCTQMIHS